MPPSVEPMRKLSTLRIQASWEIPNISYIIEQKQAGC
jgi:hypothetical protein